jgi:hypothetical protein
MVFAKLGDGFDVDPAREPVSVKIPGWEFLSSRRAVYRTAEALVPVQKLLREAGVALSEKRRASWNFKVPPVIGAAAGTAAGGAVGAATVTLGAAAGAHGAAAITSGLAFAGSIVGGGMVAGMAVAAAPAAVLAVAGYAALARRNQRKLVLEKQALLQDALRKHDAVIRAQQQANIANADELSYLRGLVARLEEVIGNLRGDLGQAA